MKAYKIYPRYRVSENHITNKWHVVLEKDSKHSGIILATFDNKQKAKEYIRLRREGRIK